MVSPKIPDIANQVIQLNDSIFNCITIVRSAIATNDTGITIYTTENRRGEDFYLVGCCIAHDNDGTAVSTVSTITAPIDGATQTIFALNYPTLARTQENGNISFSFPIKIDKSGTIRVNNEDATANVQSRGIIYGFYR